jgi:hypothetical protein
MPNCSSRKRWWQRRVKKNLFADLLAADLMQEIETLLGRQAVEDLDLEALELANRSCNWREPRSSNVSTPTPAMSEARELVVVVGRKRAWSDAEANRCRAFSVPSNWSAPTIIDQQTGPITYAVRRAFTCSGCWTTGAGTVAGSTVRAPRG